MSRCKDEIAAITQHIRSENPELPPMAARNTATTEYCKYLQKNDLPEYKQYQNIAKKIREGEPEDYANKTEGELAESVKHLPSSTPADCSFS